MTQFLTEADDSPAEPLADARAFLARCTERRNAKPRTATIARKYEQVDVIVVEPNMHGIGWQSFFCETSFRATTFRSHLSLTDFARQHFGSGILRKIATNRYAVLIRKKQAPVAWGDEFDRPRAA